jgi:hypothetical protein
VLCYGVLCSVDSVEEEVAAELKQLMDEVWVLGSLSHPSITRFCALCLDPPMIVMQVSSSRTEQNRGVGRTEQRCQQNRTEYNSPCQQQQHLRARGPCMHACMHACMYVAVGWLCPVAAPAATDPAAVLPHMGVKCSQLLLLLLTPP